MVETFLYILSILLKICIVPVAVLIYKKKLTFLQGLFVCALLFVASFGCEIYYLNISNGYSYIDSVANVAFSDMKAVFSIENGLTAEQAAGINSAIEYARNIYFALFPSVVVCSQLVGAYFWLMVSKGILALCKKDVSGFMRFCDFKMSRAGLLVGLLSAFVFGFLPNTRLSYAFLNLAVIIFFATFVCGFSVMDFKLRRRFPFSVFRLVLYMIVITLTGFGFGLGASVLLIMGIIDALFDLRTPKKRINDGEE